MSDFTLHPSPPMVFNWFRRQYSASEDPSQEASPQQPQEEPSPPAPPEQTAASTQSEASPASTQPASVAPAEDYLLWAKAAYKNIQQKQKSPAEITEAITAEPTEPQSPVEEAEAQTPPTVASATEAVASQAPAPLETVAAVETTTEAAPSQAPAPLETEPATVAIEVAETVVLEASLPSTPEAEITEAPISENAVETAPEVTEPAPFWLRAQAERQARIDRLKETAIEEPEPTAPQPATALETQPEAGEAIPDLAFDEGFLWSSEILASQGRRPDQVSMEEITWLQKLRRGLERTRRSLINQLKAIVGQGPLNQDAVMEIEALLLQADVGVEATDVIISALQKQLREEVLPPEQAIAFLKKILRQLLDAPCQKKAAASATPLHPAYSLTFAPEKDAFNIWLIVGVNGAGKTTTIGKLAHIAQKSGYKTLIAAADTFRAAAVEQVKIWAGRSGVEVIANPGHNTDPAAVVFDAIAAAQARGTELLIVDTAGRLQNKKNLMDELSKIRRIVDKKAPGAVVESLLVLDATLGQNGLRQAEVFSEAAQLSGVVLTKLDGTAKGGVALAVVQQLGLPIRFIGVGESIEDLRPFSSYEFIEALLSG